MNVPDLGVRGVSTATLLLIAAVVLLGVPLLTELSKAQKAGAQQAPLSPNFPYEPLGGLNR